MRVFVLTPIYAITTSNQAATPVVHYFTREWARMGHDVTVFHFDPKFPRIMYWVGRHFQHQLNTRLGLLVPVQSPVEEDYEAEGVTIHRRNLKKVVPHSRYSKKQLQKALKIIAKECELSGVPDWFIGHWDNPQLELLCALKQKFHKPTCLVLHSNQFNFEGLYGEGAKEMLAQIDVIGFRNKSAQVDYESKYGKPNRSFFAFSGVSSFFLEAGKKSEKLVRQPVRNFLFVGSLIARKYPKVILSALSRAYPEGDFAMTYIGDGAEKGMIEEEYQRLGEKGKLQFTGRVPREKIIEYLINTDVFIMISSAEIFGLVYLEAMALGVIPVGSKNEGIDGVIQNGENGFLCKAGDVNELTEILKKIKLMSSEQLLAMSKAAKKTAFEFSDEGVANKYINFLINQ